MTGQANACFVFLFSFFCCFSKLLSVISRSFCKASPPTPTPLFVIKNRHLKKGSNGEWVQLKLRMHYFLLYSFMPVQISNSYIINLNTYLDAHLLNQTFSISYLDVHFIYYPHTSQIIALNHLKLSLFYFYLYT